MKKLICRIKGHKKYMPKSIDGADIITIRDSLGSYLVSVNICERCGAVYSDYPAKGNMQNRKEVTYE